MVVRGADHAGGGGDPWRGVSAAVSDTFAIVFDVVCVAGRVPLEREGEETTVDGADDDGAVLMGVAPRLADCDTGAEWDAELDASGGL